MDPPPPQRGRGSRYGGGSGQPQQFPFVVDPTEAAGAEVRAFFPARGGEPPPSSLGDRAPPGKQQRYGEISLGHVHGHGHGHGQGMHHHRYHQFGVEGKQHDGGGGPSAPLPRHSSSPPGFFSNPVVDNGFLSARAGAGVGGEVHHAMSSSYHKKMKSPMNLTGPGSLSHISDDGVPDLTNNVHGIDHSEENITANSVARSFSTGFSIGPWEDSNSIVFSNPASKAGVHNNDDIIASLSNYELQFGVTKETAGMDKYLQMQQDQVPFRVRAKRGCATHPRSIAERERRTRISEKLRKLQALVPNMDKQTSTADMLDLAVDHIRGLQSELQALKDDKEKCTCRGNHPSGR